ncbi:SDR family NAD(P)-dependent oxidoreductase [Egibacter rhizosphaerae]|uniref:SDR family NAD(P)-dependent oxidoreductase n=1 Tax=Egibacter rhizosphaerae TaxID=1670831 RepID=A0A411YKY9_9ACTN|nr:SDR family NAD(P)-dependent oxidoreductase [Egibacter rhizosphaerae]
MQDRVAVVTGASSGIGRATALELADRGAAVVVTARREDALDEVAQACRERGAEAIALPADVTDADAVDDVARRTAGTYGRIDVWINNASVNLFAPIEEAPVELWHRVVQTNLFGAYHGVRGALPWMREQGEGVIVNVGSVLSRVGSPYQSAYVTSKHAVRALSDCARQEVGDVPGIDVCTVLPGPVDTPLFHHAGNYTGREVEPVTPVASAQRAAATIVACAARPRHEAIVGASTAPALVANRLAPSLVERVAARQVAKDHFGTSPARASPGNLVESTGATTVSGGWSRGSQQVGVESRRAASTRGGGIRIRGSVVAGVVASAALAVWAVRRA